MLLIELGDYCGVDNAEEQGFEWVITDYQSGSYEGSGIAVGYKDGKLFSVDLGHCSCYGPAEGGFDLTSFVTVEEALRDKDNIHDADFSLEIKAKIRELLNK